MSERIDHAAAAVGMLKDAQAAQDLSLIGIIAQGAQVHATLALVEQQRIANLLTLSELEGSFEGCDPTSLLKEYKHGYKFELKDDLREALGL